MPGKRELIDLRCSKIRQLKLREQFGQRHTMQRIQVGPRKFTGTYPVHHRLIGRAPAVGNLRSRYLPSFLTAEVRQSRNQTGPPIDKRPKSIEQEDFHAGAYWIEREAQMGVSAFGEWDPGASGASSSDRGA